MNYNFQKLLNKLEPLNYQQVMKEGVGRARLYLSKYKFTQEVKEEDKPPFPSVPTYDAKAWPVMREYAKKGSLFWNVGK